MRKNYTAWSFEEETKLRILRNNKESIQDIAAKIGRSQSSVRAKAFQMRLPGRFKETQPSGESGHTDNFMQKIGITAIEQAMNMIAIQRAGSSHLP